MKRKLAISDKRKRFCREYVKDLNAKQAAIRAGYSERTARMQGSRLLTKDDVIQEVRRLQARASEKYGITMQRLVDEYKALALTTSDSLFDYVDEYIVVEPEKDGKPAKYKKVRKAYLKPHDELTDAQLAAIQAVKETNQGIEIKLHDKKGALDSLTKILGGFVDKHELSGANGGPIEAKFTVNFIDNNIQEPPGK